MWYLDADADGWYITTMSCSSPGIGWSTTQQTQLGDCNDNNNTVYPGATEICGNGIDEDCSGADLPCGGGSCPPAVVTIAPNSLNALWANQGANDPYTFYYGVADAKRLNARIQGGVGPFGYTWTSNNSTYLLPRTYYPTNSIDLFRPTGPATITVTVTDSSNLCQYTATINILWDNQYFCGVVNQTWYLNMCQNGQNVCVPWSVARIMLQTNTASLGSCNTKNSITSALPELQMLLTPNPNNGQFNVAIYQAQEAAILQIFSVEGRLLFEENVTTQKGAFAKSFDYSAMPAGMYLVRVSDGLNVKTEKMMIRH